MTAADYVSDDESESFTEEKDFIESEAEAEVNEAYDYNYLME